jgi:histidinol dehydrogenase
MLAIPARVAGVARVSLVTPPRPEGLNPAIALAADLCGIEEIWAIGGAHAIAALAFGAGRIEAVDLIAGPGNAWVAAAKALVASHPGGPRIDLPAGPSELMVIADDKADARLVAADLLSQAEHDRSAQVMLVTTSEKLANRVEDEIERQLATLPRAATARAALDYARVIIVNDPRDSAKIANLYAPEHLSLAIAEPEALVPMITNAGAIFAGSYAAESFGDYAAGSSHVLPTDGAARAWSGVSTETFMKAVSVQEVSASAANELASACAILARAEGLEAHARAAELRLAGAA